MTMTTVSVRPTDNSNEALLSSLLNRDAFLEAGFSILPLTDTRKNPAGKWMHWQTRRPSMDDVIAWMSGDDDVPYSAQNTGIVTGAISGIVVLDLDNPRAIRFAQKMGLPHTPMASTPRGRHVFFRHPGHSVQNAVDIFHDRRKSRPHAPEGFDIRGDGGFVVGAGSYYIPTPDEIEDGKVEGPYAWIVRPEDAPFADLPAWVLAVYQYRHVDPSQPVEKPKIAALEGSFDDPAKQERVKKYVAAILARVDQELSFAMPGHRNTTIFKGSVSLGRLVGGGLLDESEATSLLRAAASMSGHKDKDAHPTIESGLRTGKADPLYGPPDDPDYAPAKRRISLAKAMKKTKMATAAKRKAVRK